MIKSVFMTILGLTGIVFLLIALAYWTEKKINIGLANVLSSANLNLLFTVVMILLMFFTIWANDKSLRESTDKTMKTLKEEVSRQIESYKNFSDGQIAAIKTLTENQIKQAEIARREKGRIDILTLRKEIELNQRFILSNIKDKETHLKGITDIISHFQTAAYEQGMITSYLTDENLINDILILYADLCSANELIQMAINADILSLPNKQTTIAYYNKNIIDLCENNKDRCDKVIKKLLEAEKDFTVKE
jgi:uncharacterized membrane protein